MPTEGGFLTLRRQWKVGDTITLDFPMAVRQVAADPNVSENLGRLAMMRGPVVYCLEDVDNPCPVDEVAIPQGAEFDAQFRDRLLGGVTLLKVKGQQTSAVAEAEGGAGQGREVVLTAVPYFAWDNRQPGRMVVWVPTSVGQPNPVGGNAAGQSSP